MHLQDELQRPLAELFVYIRTRDELAFESAFDWPAKVSRPIN